MPSWRGAQLKHRDNFIFYLFYLFFCISVQLHQIPTYLSSVNFLASAASEAKLQIRDEVVTDECGAMEEQWVSGENRSSLELDPDLPGEKPQQLNCSTAFQYSMPWINTRAHTNGTKFEWPPSRSGSNDFLIPHQSCSRSSVAQLLKCSPWHVRVTVARGLSGFVHR
jgi:hypothetical protein